MVWIVKSKYRQTVGQFTDILEEALEMKPHIAFAMHQFKESSHQTWSSNVIQHTFLSSERDKQI